jgi:hypothetical protein|tara:strand:+ start:338 stop:568 length:231 start_codon:yes stop_codon:yes gene_type:complete
MIKLEIKGNRQQTIKKVCNECGCDIENLSIENIVVSNKVRGRGDNGLIPIDLDGSEITREELPDNLKVSVCENCDD